MQTMIPEDLSGLNSEALDDLKTELHAEFDKALDENAEVALLTEIADAVDLVNGTLEIKANEAAEEEAAKDALKDRMNGEAELDAPSDAVDEDHTTAEAPADGDMSEPVEVAELEKEVVTASGKAPSARAVSDRSDKPDAPPADSLGLVITASADVPSFSNGQRIDRKDLATAMHARARGLGDSAGKGSRFNVASIQVPIAEHLIVRDGTTDAGDIMDEAVREVLAGKNAEALVASGGWCAPSETIYDTFGIESRDGLLDLPTIGVTRGGVQWPQYQGLAATAGSLWTWTNVTDLSGPQAITDLDVAAFTASATVTAHGYVTGQSVSITGTGVALLDNEYVITVVDANTFTFITTAADTTNATGTVQAIKNCLQIPCPTFDEARLTAEGLCVTHGNLMDRAYPEGTARFLDLVMTAHMHRLAAAQTAAIIASATAVTHAGATSDAAGELLDAIDLQVADYRSQYTMGLNSVLDCVMPAWVHGAVRASLAMRAGVSELAVTDGQINAFFTVRNIRPQFVTSYDALYRGATPAVAWPATCKILLYPAGGYLLADGGSIDLGVVRDSLLNATNDYTAAWSEQFYAVLQRGPAAREITVPTVVNGQTGGPQFVGA